MIVYGIFLAIVFMVAIIVVTDKYNPVLQFSFIVGLGFLYLYDEEDHEKGIRVIHQFMIGILLFSITYIKPSD